MCISINLANAPTAAGFFTDGDEWTDGSWGHERDDALLGLARVFFSGPKYLKVKNRLMVPQNKI